MFISKRKYNQMLDYIEELERNHLRDRGCITWLKGKIDGLKNIKDAAEYRIMLEKKYL